MFKWTKRRPIEEPSTPKLSSVSLPEETPAKATAPARWMSDRIPQPTPTFPSKAPDHRSKSRHSVAPDALAASQPTIKSSRTKSSLGVASDENLKPVKPAKTMIWDEDNESGYLSSRESKLRPERRPSSKDGVQLKGILKPPKSFKEQEYSKPVIPTSSHPEKGGPYNYNEASAGLKTPAMRGSEKLHRTSSERHVENTSQDAAHSRYRPLQPVFPQGAGMPAVSSGYPSHAPANGMKGQYYPESTSQPTFSHPVKPAVTQQNPPPAPSLYRHSSRNRDWGGGQSDTEGLPRAPRSSRRTGGMLTDTEDMSRPRSSRYGSVAPHDMQRGDWSMHHGPRPLLNTGYFQEMHQAAQQPSHGYDHSGRHRATTYPVYPVSSNISATDHFQGVENYTRSRTHSYSGQGTPAQSRPPVSSRYVKPYFNAVPQKEESVALSWPLLENRKRHRQRQPALFFDIAFDPGEHGRRYGIRALDPGDRITRPMSQDELDTPASSHCVLTEMKIVCEERELGRWHVIAKRPEGLRCIDVFQAIYDSYHIPLTPKEIKELGEYIRQCIPTFLQRCKDSPGLELKNQERGMCRVDLLRTKKLFKCLTRRDGHWILEVEKPNASQE